MPSRQTALLLPKNGRNFSAKKIFLVGISLDGTPDVHDALRPDVSGDGTWTRVMQMIKLLEQYHIECNLLCVVTKRLAKKAERVYKSMKATGVRYLQFIPCLDPLGAQRGIENYSLSPELYAQFLCALFDAWYRDWKTGVYVSVRLFEDYIQLLMGAPTGTCSTTGACGSYGCGGQWRCLPVRLFTVWEPTNSERFKMTLYNRCFWGENAHLYKGWPECPPQNVSNANGYGCAVVAASATVIQQTKPNAVTIAKALQKFFAYAEPRMREMARAVQMYR